MEVSKPATKLYCNRLALEKGFDPVGYAGSFTDSVIIEVPMPWKNNMYQKAGTLPQEVVDLLTLWGQRYQAGQGYPHQALMIAPDADYSRQGLRRVMFYSRPAGMFAYYHKVEYWVPAAEIGALVWALHEAPENLVHFEQYRDIAHDSTRDLLVCTHGTVDAACAKFGYPLYNTLRRNFANDHTRVWRVSHFGGHIFAPTMMDMPTGHYWAYVEDAQAQQIVERQGAVRSLYAHYRGWAGLQDSFLQAAERELWMRYGWEWFTYARCGQITAQDNDPENPKWADVQIEYRAPNMNTVETYKTRVEVQKHIHTPHGTQSKGEYPYPQYVVTNNA